METRWENWFGLIDGTMLGPKLGLFVGASVGFALCASDGAPLQSRQARRGKTRPFRRRIIVHNHLHLLSELGVGGRNPAN